MDVTTVITAIADLSLDNMGTIKVCTINKSPIRDWKYENGNGTRFSIKLFDNSGKIRCDVFCKDNPPLIGEGRVYLISGYKLKLIDNDYYKTNDTYRIVIENCKEDNNIIECLNEIPLKMHLNVCPLNQLEHQQIDQFIDVLGVVVRVNNVEFVYTAITEEERPRKDIFITDNSLPNNEVCVTLWGEKVDHFNFLTNKILAIKDARVIEYEGERKLTIGFTSVIDYDPDLSEQQEFRQWYDSKFNN